MDKDKKQMDTSKEEKEENEIAQEDFKYGWFSFTPACLQFMNNIIAFTTLMTIANTFSSGTNNGFAGVAQSQIEIRFQLTSQQSSYIGTAYEITTIPVMIFIAYVGSKGVHRPRWASAGLLFTCAGCFLYALPHFTTPVYDPAGDYEEEDSLCKNRTEDLCESGESAEDSSNLQNYLYVFILARVCLACGSSPLYQFGVTFMDDCLTKGKFSLYSSIFAAGGILGPAMGYILGGYFLTLWTDFPTVSDPGIEPSDPRWVGAWWLGFLISGVGVVFVMIPMSGYPKDLPGAKAIRDTKESEAFASEGNDIPEDINKIDFTAKDVPRYLKDIFTNWSFVFLALYICCDIAIIAGMALYGPKFGEIQYELTAGASAALLGILIVPAGVIGTILGGVIVDKLSLSIVGIMKAEILASILTISMGGCLLLYCDAVPFAGVDSHYPPVTVDSDYNLTSTCNAHCTCDDLPYNPVCAHSEDMQYFSPCHAGCLDYIESDSRATEYFNCSCVAYNSSIDEGAEAYSGICPTPECYALIAYSIMIFIAMCGLFMSEAMNISAIYRVVPNTHRMFASMCQSIMLRIFGTVPAPIIFGLIFDASCILWQDTCGEQGSCFFYDKQKLAYLVFSICVGYKCLALIFMICAWKFYVPPKTVVIDEKEINGGVSNDAFVSTSDLNKRFDRQYSNVDKNAVILNGCLTYVDPGKSQYPEKGESISRLEEKSNEHGRKEPISDMTVNEFFMASGVESSPLISGRILTTAL